MRENILGLLARKFLLSRQSDGFISMISWVSVTGVALGVLALVVVTSVIRGFENELERVIVGMNGDVILYSRAEPVAFPGQVEEKLRALVPEAKAITHSFMTELMVAGPQGVAGAVLEGVNLATLGAVTRVPENVTQGRLPRDGEDEIALGEALAERIGAKVGDEIRLVAPFSGAPPASAPDSPTDLAEAVGQPKVARARLTGIVKMGMHDYDSKFAFVPLGFAQGFFGQPGKVTSFKVRLSDGADPRRVSDLLSEQFGFPFRAKDWGQLNKNLFYAIELEKIVISIILTAIVIVAAFNVVSTLMMMIHDKTREISILKAVGLRRGQCFSLFVWIGMGIGVVGTAGGILAGLGVNGILKRTRLIDLPSEIYHIGYLPVHEDWHEIGTIAAVALVICFLATLYPALQVSRRSPLDGLRYE